MQHHIHIGHIDASGSQNPGVTHEYVIRAVKAGVEHASKSIPKSMNEHKMRHASNRR